MTSSHSLTSLLNLNPDLLRMIGRYLDVTSKYHLKQVNKQTFSPTWPIYLCNSRRHKLLKYPKEVLDDPFYDRDSCIIEVDKECSRCGLMTCLTCGEDVEYQSCDLCDLTLCERCQNRTGGFSQCLCSNFFCGKCGDADEDEPICDDCIDFQRG